MLQFTSYATTTTANANTQTHVDNFTCDDISHAHDIATKKYPNAIKINVYANTQNIFGDMDGLGITYGAITVVKRTTANCIQRQGTTAQHIMYKNVRNAFTNFDTVTDWIACDTRRYSQDVQDMISVAIEGITDAISCGDTLVAQYANAYKYLNKYLYDNRTKFNLREYSIEQLTDDGIELINVWRTTNILLTPESNYNFDTTDDIDNNLGNVIRAFMSTITPTQLQITRGLAWGYSQRSIAEKMQRGVSTIAGHVAVIRRKAIDYFSIHAPYVIKYLSSDNVNAIINKGKQANKN